MKKAGWQNFCQPAFFSYQWAEWLSIQDFESAIPSLFCRGVPIVFTGQDFFWREIVGFCFGQHFYP